MINKIRPYLLYFFLYSALGWVYEVVLALLYGWGFVNRGFLFGPYLPVYGVGAVILVLCLSPLTDKSRRTKALLSRVASVFFVFLLVVLITTVLEYVTGLLLWELFHRRWWDYSGDFMNLNGYVCPRTSLRFGLGGLFFLYVCQPFFQKLYERIPQGLKTLIPVGLIGVMALDLCATVLLMSR